MSKKMKRRKGRIYRKAREAAIRQQKAMARQLNKVPMELEQTPGPDASVKTDAMSRELAADLALPITELGIRGRALAALSAAGYKTVDDLRRVPEKAITQITHVGSVTVDKLKEGLRGLGFGFADNPPQPA